MQFFPTGENKRFNQNCHFQVELEFVMISNVSPFALKFVIERN